MSEEIPNTDSILEKSKQIIENSVDPIAGPPEAPSDGLLYGLIQSGKTSIITAAAAMAADNGFKCLIILTSDNNPLYGQTRKRTRQALRGLKVLGKNEWEDKESFERQVRNSPFAVICSKNTKTLNGIIQAFKSAGSKGARGLPTLIIDDEADQASLNTKTSKGTDEISTINRLISELREFFSVNTYLQVTATPQALFLQTPDHPYRPSFTVLSEPGEGYVGGEAFFGTESKLLRIVDINEIEELRSTHQPTATDTVPKGLRDALLVFLIAATAKKMKKDAQQYAFLCHVSHTQIDHDRIRKLIERFIEETKTVLDDSETAKHKSLLKDLRKAFDDLVQTEANMPIFENVIEKLGFYISGANIKLINATSNEEITLDHLYNLFVGGNKLGRGVTIENLIVSYYGRNPKHPNSDTVLQHARMYGYRECDLGVTRLFLPEKLAEHFRLIHQMEKALRELVEKHPKGNFEGIYVASPLHVTRRNVLDPNSIGLYIAGSYCNPRYPLRSVAVKQHTAWLDAELAPYGDDQDYHTVNVDFLIRLIEKCEADPNLGADLWNIKTISAGLETLKTLRGDTAYLTTRRGRNLNAPREERQGFLAGGEEALAPKDAPTLFIYRNNASSRGVEAWWPMIRFPEGNYALAFSFER
ncbi:MAG: Z1 domain-containing protein [Terracidiphilus sp.]